MSTLSRVKTDRSGDFLERLRVNVEMEGYWNIKELTKEDLLIAIAAGFRISYDSTNKRYVIYPQFREGLINGYMDYNNEVIAAIVNAGGNPITTSYPLKHASADKTIAGGAGVFASATIVTAVSGKKIFIEELRVGVKTDDAGAGLSCNLADGAGGSVIAVCLAGQYQPQSMIRPLRAGTAGNLIELQAAKNTFATLADGDVIRVDLKYREI